MEFLHFSCRGMYASNVSDFGLGQSIPCPPRLQVVVHRILLRSFSSFPEKLSRLCQMPVASLVICCKCQEERSVRPAACPRELFLHSGVVVLVKGDLKPHLPRCSTGFSMRGGFRECFLCLL